MNVNIHRHQGIDGGSDGDFSACKVLMVEPTVGTARLLGAMLMKDLQVGAVKRVATLAEAVKALSTGEFNVLATDWSPQTDALKLVSALRSPKSVDRYMPVIVITANGGQKNVRMLRDVGVDEVVHKPFTLRMLRSRLKHIATPGRAFILHGQYFGPDRRRYRASIDSAAERRKHANAVNPDRRQKVIRIQGPERRQGLPGYLPPDRRANNVRTKIAELEKICVGLDVPQLLALRRMTLADPRFQDRHYVADLNDFFTVQLLVRLENYSYEKLEEIAPTGFGDLLPPGSEAARTEDTALLGNLTRHLLATD